MSFFFFPLRTENCVSGLRNVLICYFKLGQRQRIIVLSIVVALVLALVLAMHKKVSVIQCQFWACLSKGR